MYVCIQLKTSRKSNLMILSYSLVNLLSYLYCYRVYLHRENEEGKISKTGMVTFDFIVILFFNNGGISKFDYRGTSQKQ